MEDAAFYWLALLGGYILASFTALRIVLERREPTATLAWVLGILLVPYIGVLIYILIGRRRLNRQVRRRRARAKLIEARLTQAILPGHDSSPSTRPHTLAPPANNVLARFSSRIGCRWPTVGNNVSLLVDSANTYAAMENAIMSARHHIHFQFYIFQPDATGIHFRNLLVEKARSGVQVRVLTDGVGSWDIDEIMVPLLQAGGQHATFLPVARLTRQWHPNLRNHRKIVIIDGRVGFTGSGNIGDQYTGGKPLGPLRASRTHRRKKTLAWRDTYIQIEGPAVHHLQEVFADDWFFATGEDPEDEAWFPAIDKPDTGGAMVHIVASGPDTDSQPIQRIFFAAICSASDRVYLTTPYFVPDLAMLAALETAALRGVDVRLLLPSKSDAPLALHAGRSYYDDLIQSGVRIYEYTLGMLHAKTMVVDDAWATVGSANMDMRSFKLNFEVNAAVYGKQLAKQLVDIFEHDLRNASEIRGDDLRKIGFGRRSAESFARILSPLL